MAREKNALLLRNGWRDFEHSESMEDLARIEAARVQSDLKENIADE